MWPKRFFHLLQEIRKEQAWHEQNEKNKKQKVRNYGFGDPDADQNEAESGKNSNSQLSAAIVSENKMTVHPER